VPSDANRLHYAKETAQRNLDAGNNILWLVQRLETAEAQVAYLEERSTPVPESNDEIRARFIYRVPTDKQRELLAQAHQCTLEYVNFLLAYIPDSRDRAIALTFLESARMMVNKAIVFAEVG
jgi:hypothetical protein